MLLVPMPQLLRKARNTFKNAFMGKQGNWMTQMQIKTFFLFFFTQEKELPCHGIWFITNGITSAIILVLFYNILTILFKDGLAIL